MSVIARYFPSQILFFIKYRKLSDPFIRSLSGLNGFRDNNLDFTTTNLSLPLLQPKITSLSHIRTKYSRKSSSEQAEDSDSDEESEEFKDERDSKVIKAYLNSLRADLVLKAGLGLARNKVEVAFYESRIRVNGRKIPKKSMQLHIDDEIDVIKDFSTVNPSLLIVSRVIILSAKDNEENILVHLRRYKNLLIENYEGVNAYKSSDS